MPKAQEIFAEIKTHIMEYVEEDYPVANVEDVRDAQYSAAALTVLKILTALCISHHVHFYLP